MQLLRPGTRIDPFTENIVMHMKTIDRDLVLYPLNVLHRRRYRRLSRHGVPFVARNLLARASGSDDGGGGEGR